MSESVAAGFRSSSRSFGTRTHLRVGAVGSDLFLGGHGSASTARGFRRDRDPVAGCIPDATHCNGAKPPRAVEIESRLKRFGFDSIALNAEVYVQARDQLEIFDNLQRAQQRRMVLLREISIRREFAKRMKRVSDRVIEGRVSLARQAVPKEPDVGVTSASSNR